MPNTPQTIAPLTSIRGIAALWVYLYHCHFLASDNAAFVTFRQLGYFGVDVFFILSGFIISHVYLNQFLTAQEARSNTLRFLVLRLGRVYPLQLATLLAVVALQAGHVMSPGPEDGAITFVQNLFMVQSWSGRDLSWNLIAWSISVEWFVYLLFPLLCWGLLARLKDTISNLLLLALALSLWLVYSYATDLNISSMHAPGYTLPRGLLDFLIGASLLQLSRKQFLTQFAWDLAAVAALLGLAGAICYAAYWPPRRYFALDATFVALFALLVYSLAHSRTFVLKVFANPALEYLGTISYSVYMLHLMYLLILTGLGLPLFRTVTFLSWPFLVMTLGLVAVSALSYHLIERPARSWVRAAAANLALKPVAPGGYAAGVFAVFAAAMFSSAMLPALPSSAPAPVNGAAALAAPPVQQPPPSEQHKAAFAAATSGDPIAQYNLGSAYYQGQGVQQSYTVAFKWFSQSAQKGFVPSYYSLGNLYANGQGVGHDAITATSWYRKAANLGYADGQLALGLRLAAGDGVDKDNTESLFWLTLSAAAGSKVAQSYRAGIVAKLTPREVADAEARASTWQARPNRLWEQHLAAQQPNSNQVAQPRRP